MAKLLAHWKLNDNIATTDVIDSAGLNPGIANKNTNLLHTTGKINGGFNFDGANDIITVAASSSLNFDRTTPFSIAFWIKTTDEFQYVISKLNINSPWDGWEIGISYGKVILWLINTWDSNLIGIDSQSNISDNSWKHVVITYNGSSLASGVKIYINAIDDTDAPMYDRLSGSITSNRDVYIGARGGATAYDNLTGIVDDIRVYGHELTPAEVAELYNAGNGTEDDLAALASKYYSVELRDKSGYLKAFLTPKAKDVSWEWNRIGGCGRCRIKIGAEYRSIEFNARDDIQIRIKSGTTSKLVYRGWISGITPSLKIPQEITLDVRGYFDILDFLIIQNSGDKITYSNQLVSDIVTDIVDDFITPNSSIAKGVIDGATFNVDTLQFKSTVTEALKTLADLEGNIEYGVDENLVFFWRVQSSAPRKKFIVGNDVESLERKIDWSKLLNKIYFEGGDVSGSPYRKTAEVIDSQSMYFLAEGILNNTSITTSAVADQYLSATLKSRSSPQLVIRGKVLNTNFRLEDIIPIGEISFYDSDYDEGLYIVGEAADGGSDLTVGLRVDGGSNATVGGVYSGQIDTVAYTLSETEDRFNIEITMGGEFSETTAKIKQIELLLSNIRQNQ